MKAAVCREFDRPLSVEDIQLDAPKSGEVRIAIKACGVCHSDIHYIEGAWGGDLPAVFGHEAAGVIEDVGEGVDGLRPGQHAVATLIRACRRCRLCLAGQSALCEGTLRLDSETPIHAMDGTPILQGIKTGAFAEAVVVDTSQVVPIDDDVPLASACLLACAVITGFGAVVNTARVEAGSHVVVIGAGGVGMNAIQAAALTGAAHVIAVDVAPAKLEMASRFGATDTVDATDPEAAGKVRSLANGDGADVAIVTVGSSTAVEQAVRMVGRAGAVVLVGMPPTGAMSSIDSMMLAYRGLRILGSKMGSSQPQIDIPRLIALYQAGRLKLDELVSNHYSLAQINEAVRDTKCGESIRNIVEM